MKYLKIILIIILLSACSLNKKEENKQTQNYFPTTNNIARKEETNESKNLPKDFRSDKLVVNADEVEEFYNTDLGHFSYYIPRQDKGDYKVTWNLLDGSEVYYCFVESDKYQKASWCKCYKSEGFDRWLNGEELIEYEEEIIDEDTSVEKKESTQEKYSNMYEEMCNNPNVSDYLDLYDEYEQEFEDEDDAFNIYYEYCE